MCNALTASDRNPDAGEVVYFKGATVGGPIDFYRFDFGDGAGTGWLPVSTWPGFAFANHAYSHTGFFQVQFFVRTGATTTGGIGTRCALRVEVKIPTPTPTPQCGVRPPLFVVGAVQQARSLQLTGLSLDSALIDVQVKGPSDADFITNGSTTADQYGKWVYTTTMLAQNGTYAVRARGYGEYSENTIFYTLGDNPQALTLGAFPRRGGGLCWGRRYLHYCPGA